MKDRDIPVAVIAATFLLWVLIGSVAVVVMGGWWLLGLVILIPLTATLAYGVVDSITPKER